MNFSFGIITNNVVDYRIIESIKNQNIDNYEIIVVGGEDKYKGYDVKHIPFDESSGKYTVKKNMITENAVYENIVYLHDYYILSYGWYQGFLKFGNDWDISMNVILNSDGTRFRDWCVWDDPDLCFPGGGELTSENSNHRIVLPKYNYNKTQYMYISGGYWVSKKSVMEKESIDETLDWGEAEDVEWSKRVLPKYSYRMNEHSMVSLLKDKKLSAVVL